eukprot:TRINITY_DN1475_c0_g1_i4.p1 TRINITY_DN1475_c0_g1~~TRINITY_DN1475_c0_g1_i4.p1  ORF type:complete len:640 (-),score=173.75 TRINITY_DN1475_c0_g1_i4:103-2022(-)
MGESQIFGNISLLSRGSQSVGSLKLSHNGILWKKLGGGKTIELKPDDIYEVAWCMTSVGNQLKLRKEIGAMVSFIGFKDKDLAVIRELSKEFLQQDVQEEEQSITGHNWGRLQLRGSSMLWMVGGKPAFEVPLADVLSAQQTRDEVQLEFDVDDTMMKCDALVGMSFCIPDACEDWQPEEGKDDKPSKVLLEKLLQYTDAGATSSEDALAIFENVVVMCPRGRFTMEIQKSSLNLLGQTSDFKIRYNNIGRIFILPKPASNHTLVALSVDPALRKGQTLYPFILCQFDTHSQSNVEIKIEDEDFQKLNQGLDDKRKLQRSYAYSTYECVARIIKTMARVKVSKPGSFLAHDNISSSIRCSYRADDGYLYFLEHVFIFVHKPVFLIAFEEVENVEFQRQGGMLAASAKTFDFSVRMKWTTDTEFTFRGIQKEEYQHIYRFVQEKGLKVENQESARQGPGAGLQGIDVGDNVDPGMNRAGMEEDEEEEDEDFKVASSGDEDEGDSSSEDGEDVAEMIDETVDGKIIGHRQVEGGEESPSPQKAGTDSASPAKKKAKQQDGSAIKKEGDAEEGGGGAKEKKTRKKKDPDAPKRNLSAFMYFSMDKREAAKKANPEMKVTEISKVLAEQWKQVTAEDKVIYEE